MKKIKKNVENIEYFEYKGSGYCICGNGRYFKLKIVNGDMIRTCSDCLMHYNLNNKVAWRVKNG